jgi:hypothetical protein
MTGRATTDATPQRVRATFLRELRKRGNVSDAARKARIDRTTAYRWRDAEPEFAAAWDEAIEHAIDVMESEAYRRAVEGVDEPVFGRIGKDQDGEVGTIRKYSDALMNTLLKAHRPEKYRERVDVQQHGKVEIEFVNNWREAD